MGRWSRCTDRVKPISTEEK
uniref:Uncharacterized protein n=1 Tax=Arundo donax TaxID=35708 RepID=A0A0A8YZP5_ARUDO